MTRFQGREVLHKWTFDEAGNYVDLVTGAVSTLTNVQHVPGLFRDAARLDPTSRIDTGLSLDWGHGMRALEFWFRRRAPYNSGFILHQFVSLIIRSFTTRFNIYSTDAVNSTGSITCPDFATLADQASLTFDDGRSEVETFVFDKLGTYVPGVDETAVDVSSLSPAGTAIQIADAFRTVFNGHAIEITSDAPGSATINFTHDVGPYQNAITENPNGGPSFSPSGMSSPGAEKELSSLVNEYADENWHHLTFLKLWDVSELDIDGKKILSGSMPVYPYQDTKHLFIGDPAASASMRMDIDELTIYREPSHFSYMSRDTVYRRFTERNRGRRVRVRPDSAVVARLDNDGVTQANLVPGSAIGIVQNQNLEPAVPRGAPYLRSARLNGTDAYVWTANNAEIEPSVVTCECWAWLTSWSGVQPLISRYSVADGGYELVFESGELVFRVRDLPGTSTSEVRIDIGHLDPQVWRHYAGSWDGVDLRVFVDGYEAGRYTSAFPGGISYSNTPQLYVGRSASNYLEGEIADFGVHAEAIPEWELRQVRAAVLNPYDRLPFDILYWYPQLLTGVTGYTGTTESGTAWSDYIANAGLPQTGTLTENATNYVIGGGAPGPAIIPFVSVFAYDWPNAPISEEASAEFRIELVANPAAAPGDYVGFRFSNANPTTEWRAFKMGQDWVRIEDGTGAILSQVTALGSAPLKMKVIWTGDTQAIYYDIGAGYVLGPSIAAGSETFDDCHVVTDGPDWTIDYVSNNYGWTQDAKYNFQPLGLWNFDFDDGTGVVLSEASSNALGGTAVNIGGTPGVNVVFIESPIGQYGYDFPDDSGSRIEITDSSNVISVDSSYIFDVWFSLKSVGTVQRIATKGDAVSPVPLDLVVRASGQLEARVTDGTTTISALAPKALVVDRVYRATVVWYSGAYRLDLYLDGAQVASDEDGALEKSSADNGDPFYLGAGAIGGGYGFDGRLYAARYFGGGEKSAQRVFDEFHGSRVVRDSQDL